MKRHYKRSFILDGIQLTEDKEVRFLRHRYYSSQGTSELLDVVGLLLRTAQAGSASTSPPERRASYEE